MTTHYLYKVTNKITGHFYIGYTKSPKYRWRDHKRSAKIGESSRFYNALRKYGPDAFEFELTEEVESKQAAKDREIELIALLKPEYNCTKGGDGGDPCEETRMKLSASMKTSPKALAHQATLWDKRRANMTPEELSQLCSEVQANMTPEQKAQRSRKLSEAQAARTEEEEAERQRKRAETVANWTPEQKASYSAKITEHNLTRVLSEEAQQKISQGQVTGGHIVGQLMKERLEAMSQEDKDVRMANIVKGIKDAAKNRTQEQKDEITRKRLESRARNKDLREQQILLQDQVEDGK